MRKWQTITITALSTLTLSTAGFVTYNAMQPTYHASQVFNNESSVSTSTSVSQSQSASEQSSAPSSAETVDTEETVDTTTTTIETYRNAYGHEMTVGDTNDPTGMAKDLPGSTPAEQPTFALANGGYAETAEGKVEVCIAVHRPSRTATKLIPTKDAEPFIAWMESIAYGKQTLDHSLHENYNYWKQNVKGQQ